MGHVKDLKTGIKYKDTPIGKIPVDWELAKLKRIATGFYNGGTPDTTNMDYWDGSIPWITGADFEDQKVKTIRRYITSDGVKNSATNVVPKGNLLIVTRTGVGKIAIAPFDIAISQDITGVILDSQKASPEFIYWYIDFISTRLKSTIQGTSISGLLRDDLEEIDLPLPTIAEQKKIAEILTTVDEAIEKTDQIIEKTKEVKKGLMQKLLTRGIGHKKFKKTEIGEMPVEWKVGAFSEIADINPKRDLEKGVSYPFVEMAAIDSESHNVQFSKPRKYEGSGTKFQNGDTLFARITPCTENGKTAYVDFLKENNFGHGSTEFIVLGPPKNVDSKFIYYCARWDKVRNIAVSKMEGTSGRQRVPSRVFSEDIFIPMPPLPEQKQITEILSSVDEEIERETSHKEQLGLLKKGLMQVLLTGKIRVVV